MLFLLLITLTCASCVFQFGTAVYDFTNLIGQDLEYKIADLGETSPYYRFSACSNLLDPCLSGFGQMSMPQFGSLYLYRNDEMCTPLGQWTPNDMKISGLDVAAASIADYGAGISLIFENGPTCMNAPTRIRYNMLCDMGSDTGHFTVSQKTPCSYTINWPTKYACSAGIGPAPGTVIPVMPFPATPRPVLHTTTPARFGFHGNYRGNATCSEPIFDCFQGVLGMDVQLECKSCSECAVVIMGPEKAYSAMIQTDVCKQNVLAGPLKSRQGLTGYVYLHSYSNGEMVKGTLDIMPYESSKWDLILDQTHRR